MKPMELLLWTAGTALAVAVALHFWRRRSRPILTQDIDRDDCGRWVELFFRICRDGSVIIFESRSTPRFVQFVKCVESAERAALHFGFPDARWSRPYFRKAHQALKDAGVDCHLNLTHDKRVPAFLCAEGLDPAAAERILEVLWRLLADPGERILRVTFWGSFDAREPFERLLEAARPGRSAAG